MITLQYYVRRVYGLDKIYLIDDSQRMHWYNLVGDRTVEPRKAEALTKLMAGELRFEQVPDPVAVNPL